MNDKNGNIERSGDLQRSQRIFTDYLYNKGIEQTKINVDIVWSNEDRQITFLELKNNKNQIIVDGCGKGSDHRLGALAEAIEHYFTAIETPSYVKPMTVDNIIAHPGLKRCGIISQLQSFCNASLYTVPYYSWPNTTSNIYYLPVSLVNPWCCYNQNPKIAVDQYISRYSSNSGTATGITFDDAFLHALNEEIERYYLSNLFLTISQISISPIKFYQVDISTLPDHFNCQLKLLDKDHPIKIICSFDFCNVFFCAAISQSKDPNSPCSILSAIGSGASLDINLAIKRALGEVLQIHAGCDDHVKILDLLNKSQKLQKLIHPNQHIDFANISYHNIAIAKNHHITQNCTIRNMIDYICDNLNDHNFQILYRIKTNSYDPFSVVSLYIPGFERFHLIRMGNFVSAQSWLNHHHDE